MPDNGAEAGRPHAHGPGQASAHRLSDTRPALLTYVQFARGMRWSGHSLTLVDLAPGTIYLSSSMGLLGVFSTGDFLDAWSRIGSTGQGPRALAVLSLMDACRTLLADAELVVSAPTISGDGLCYSAELLSGVLPGASGSCVLFVDAVPSGRFRAGERT